MEYLVNTFHVSDREAVKNYLRNTKDMVKFRKISLISDPLPLNGKISKVVFDGVPLGRLSKTT